MLIERGQVIAGLEAVEARRLMRELMHAAMTPAAIAEAAGDDPSTAVRFEAFPLSVRLGVASRGSEFRVVGRETEIEGNVWNYR